MSFEVIIDSDTGLLKYVKAGNPGRGSLLEIAVEGNVELVNTLGMAELWAVCCAARSAPFPLGGGEGVYRRALELIRSGKASLPDMRDEGEKRQEPLPGFDTVLETPSVLGNLRYMIVRQAGSGINAPWDSYLRIAVDIKKTGRVQARNQY